MEFLCILSVVFPVRPAVCSPPWGGPAWLLGMVWPGPRAVWRDGDRALTCSASAGGLGRFASDNATGTWGAPSGGGPKERGVAAAPSIATKYKLSCIRADGSKWRREQVWGPRRG